MPRNRKVNYTVGYRKPPKHTQFQKGQCGNLKGRPKKSKNFTTVIEEELNTRIDVTENGKPKKISKREAIAKQLVNKAAAGDPKAIPILLNEARLRENLPDAGAAQPQLTSEDDQVVMDSIVRRIREVAPDATATSEDSAEAGFTKAPKQDGEEPE